MADPATDREAPTAEAVTAKQGFPLGAALTLDQLSTKPHRHLARLREAEPVSWLPVLDGWLVTRRDLCIEVMKDADTFTVDDPRFSTAQVVGPSMLSLDGSEHRRHRDPFASAFRLSEVRDRFAARVNQEARKLVDDLAPRGGAEIRRELAGPLAVAVVSAALELADVEARTVLGWYDTIVAEVDRISAGGEVGESGREAFGRLSQHVRRTFEHGTGVLASARANLSDEEVVSNAAVIMFGGIETSEGMTTTLFWHLLTHPEQMQVLTRDRSLGPQAIEESLRLEPAASRVDRYATKDIEMAGAPIQKGDLVVVSLAGANRDPAAFPNPDQFDLSRPNARTHLAFAQGPHACVGVHLAKWETLAALDAALDAWPGLRLDENAVEPSGLVFRKPRQLPVIWSA
ncbi:MAG: cytochrome P450 [Acidimicrobiia bacterium]